jgi:hypothetical protein
MSAVTTLLVLVLSPWLLSAPARAQVDGPPINRNTHDPAALYGQCGPGGANSDMSSRLGIVITNSGLVPYRNLLGVQVIQCTEFGGGGGTTKVPCPSGSPYQSCLLTENDGLGNLVELGVLRLHPNTDPLADYSGCPPGAVLAPRWQLVQAAGKELREVNGIVTLSCGPANGPTGAESVECAPGLDLYSYCIQTHDDGLGNAVLLGVVSANGAGDPYGLYGECYDTALPGFLQKSSLVSAVHQSMNKLSSITLMACLRQSADPQIPPSLTVVSCSKMGAPAAAGFDYCIWGADQYGNYVKAGVNVHH